MQVHCGCLGQLHGFHFECDIPMEESKVLGIFVRRMQGTSGRLPVAQADVGTKLQ